MSSFPQDRALPALPGERLEGALADRKPLMTAHEALVESNRCLYCSDAPCIPSCPTSIDIPEFIRQISTENLSGAARTILSSNILGYSCARVCPVEVLCEGTCVYNALGEKPIQIGRLQRVATEYAYVRGEQYFTAGAPTGRRVALIGAGPASLACAHELRRLGHECTIFEARALPGGLNTTGVAPYKLHAEDSLRELEYVRAIGGIEVRCGVSVGQDVSFAELERDYDAIFVGVGLGPDGRLGASGEGLEGVVGAVEWIERLKLEGGYRLPAHVRRAAVVGGGNTAIDVVRELCGLGVEEVVLVYRRDEATMSGYAHEWKLARVEGARGQWFTQPVAVLDDGSGRVAGLRCQRTQVQDGRVEVVPGSDFELACEMVFLAIGQSKLSEQFSSVEGIEFVRGRFVVDPLTGQTGNPRYFAGGDCANGGKEVVNASAEGKRAARGIDDWLRGAQQAGAEVETASSDAV